MQVTNLTISKISTYQAIKPINLSTYQVVLVKQSRHIFYFYLKNVDNRAGILNSYVDMRDVNRI